MDMKHRLDCGWKVRTHPTSARKFNTTSSHSGEPLFIITVPWRPGWKNL